MPSPLAALPQKQIGGDGDVAGFGELVGDAADPIGEAENFVNDNDGRGFIFHFRIGDETVDFAVVVIDFDPFAVAGRVYRAEVWPNRCFAGRRLCRR